MLVFEERGKLETSRSRVENQQTQPTYGVESGNRTRGTLVHSREVSTFEAFTRDIHSLDGDWGLEDLFLKQPQVSDNFFFRLSSASEHGKIGDCAQSKEAAECQAICKKQTV